MVRIDIYVEPSGAGRCQDTHTSTCMYTVTCGTGIDTVRYKPEYRWHGTSLELEACDHDDSMACRVIITASKLNNSGTAASSAAQRGSQL